jgi:hypothetical protein
MNQNGQLQTAPAKSPTTRPALSAINPNRERRWFEFDRSAVLRQIDQVQGTIDANATDLGMVAAEGVFEKALSDELLRSARALNAIAQELTALRGLVASTSGYPKAERKRA